MVRLAMCSRPKPCALHLRRSGPMSAVVRLKISETSSTPNGALDRRDQRDRYPDQFMTVKEARNLHFGNGLDGAARHIGQRAAFHIVAKSPLARLAAWAHKRGWELLSLLSTVGNSYDADYFGDTSKFSKGMRAQTSSSRR